MFLAATTEKISLITNGTTTVDVFASWADLASGVVTPGKTATAIVLGAPTTTDIVGAPASSTQRTIKELYIRNKHASASTTITVQLDIGGTLYEIVKLTLLAGYTLQYKDTDGWTLIDAAGGIIVSSLVGRLVKTTVLTSGTSFTTGPSTTSIRIRMWGGGGGGGGCTSVASAASCAGGGGAGGYCEKLVAVSPNTAYTYAIGAAGAANSGAAGGNGGDTTFTVGATTYTAKGGTGGPGATSTTVIGTAFAGGAGGVVGTNGDVNAPGADGLPGVMTTVGPLGHSGEGGSCAVGKGGLALVAAAAGNAATGNGAGGGGAMTGASSARAGGAGVVGMLIVDEYS